MRRKLTFGGAALVSLMVWVLVNSNREESGSKNDGSVVVTESDSVEVSPPKPGLNSWEDTLFSHIGTDSEWDHITSVSKPLVDGHRNVYIAASTTTGRIWRVDETYRNDENGLPQLEDRSLSLANQYIVKVADESFVARFQERIAAAGFYSRPLEASGLLHEVIAGRDTDLIEFHEKLAAFSEERDWISYGEPDYLVHALDTLPNDPMFQDQRALNQPFQNGSNADIDAPQAWDERSDATDVVVAVIDSGARVTHEDLAGNLWYNPTEIANGLDDDGNGYVDDFHGINAIADNGDPSDDDPDGHGTHVAGIIAAEGNNGVGIAGVAWNARVMPLKFLDKTGSGAISDAIQCLSYAIENGAHIVNNSWGGSERSFALKEVLELASSRGILIATAAGNESSDLSESPVYPASYEIPLQLVVVATDERDRLFSFSNHDARKAHIAAPGETLSLSNQSDSSYNTLKGTSMAAPQVAGALALLYADNPGKEGSWYINRVLESAESRATLNGKCLSGSRLNLNRLLKGLSNQPENDSFQNAILISDNGDPRSGILNFATLEEGEPRPSFRTRGQSVWYRWVASRGGLAQVELSPVGYFGGLAVYQGDRIETLEKVGERFSPQSGEAAKVSVSVAGGEEYWIQVDQLSGTGSVFYLQIRLAPENDLFTNAEVLPGETFAVSSSNRAASREPGEQLAHPSSFGNSVWYRWEAPRDGQYYLNVSGTGTRMFTRAYTGESIDSLVDVSTDLGLRDLGDVVLQVGEGELYNIVVDSQSSEGGTFSLQGRYFNDPVITREPSDQFVREGEEAVFRVGVFGVGTPAYQWYLNGEEILGSVSNVLRIRNVTPENIGEYEVRIEVGGTVLVSRKARLEIAENTLRILKHPASQTAEVGDDLSLGSFIIPAESLSYQWYKNDTPIEGATQAALSINGAVEADTGFYRLEFSDGTQTRSTNEAFVYVSSDPRWEGMVNPLVEQRPPVGAERQTVNGWALAKMRNAIAFSKDGNFWQYGIIKDSNERVDVAYGNGAYVATFDWGTYVSEDLIHWEPTDHIIGSNYGVAFGNGRFVISSHNGVYISENGRDWVQQSIVGVTWTSGIGFANGEFLLQASAGAFKSPDGLSWTYWGPYGGSNRDYSEFAQGHWWARNGSLLESSADGKSWSDNRPVDKTVLRSLVDPESDRVLAITEEREEVTSGNYRVKWELFEFGEGEWKLLKTIVDQLHVSGTLPNVMVVKGEVRLVDEKGQHGLDEYVFNNSEHWPNSWWGEATFSYANGQYIGALIGEVYVSKDGVEWTRRSAPFYQDSPIGEVVHGNGIYVTTRRVGNSFGTLEPHGRQFTKLAFFKGVFVGTEGQDLLYSTDGQTWTAASGVSGPFNSVFSASSEERIVFATSAGMLVSTDGINWTVNAIPGEREFDSLAFGGGVFIGFQGDDAYRTSDGLSWNRSGVADHPSVSGAIVHHFGYVGGRFVASLSDYGLFTSVDGLSWKYIGPAYFADFVAGENSALVKTVGGLAIVGSEASDSLDIRVTRPAGRYSMPTGSSIDIEFEGFSASGEIERIRVYENDSLWSELDGSTRRITYTSDRAGSHVIRLEIENTAGEIASAIVSIESTPLVYTQVPEEDFWLHDLVYFKGAYYGAGEGGKIFQSLDGVEWKGIQTPTINRLHALETDGSVLVALAVSDGILYSRDGISWLKTGVLDTERYLIPQPADLRSMDRIQYSNGLFVVENLISEDGVLWYSTTTGELIGGSNSGGLGEARVYSDQFGYSYQGGLGRVSSRLQREVGNQIHLIRDVHALVDGFVGLSDRAIVRSSDLENWEELESERLEMNDFDRIKQVGDLFFIVDHSSVKYVSADGLEWQGLGRYRLRGDVSHTNGGYFAMGSTGTEGSHGPNVALFKSSDGLSWVQQGNSQSGAYSTGFPKLVASPVGVTILSERWYTDNELSFTVDGTDWIHRSYDNQAFRENLAIFGSDPAFALEGRGLYRKGSNEYWRPVTTERFRGLYYQNGVYLAEFGERELGTSSDLENWNRYELPVEIDQIESLFSDNDKAFWLYQYNRPLYRSVDGRSWEQRPLPENADVAHDIFRFKGKLYYANQYGRLFSSEDEGLSWTLRVDGVDSWPIERTASLMGAIREGTKLFVSSDGNTWEERNPPPGRIFELHGIDDAFYGIGDSVWRSVDGYEWELIAPYRVKAATSRSSIQFYLEHFAFIDFVDTDIEIVSVSLAEPEVAGSSPAQAKLVLRNRGSAVAKLVNGASLEVILDARKGFFGLPNPGEGIKFEIPLQEQTIGPDETVEIDMLWSLPDDTPPGEYYINAALSENAVYYDGNTSNDFYLGSTIGAIVPGHTLDIEIQGRGEIENFTFRQMYRKDANLELVAKPSFGYEFANWSGDIVSGEEALSFIMDKDYALTASFVPRKYFVDVEITEGGEVSGIPVDQHLDFGSDLNLVATPSEGWTFIGWKGDSGDRATGLDVTVGRDLSIVAQFGQTYNQWFLSQYGVGTENGLGEDYDGNGRTNLEDYALGTHKQIELQSIPLGLQYDGFRLYYRYAISRQVIGVTAKPVMGDASLLWEETSLPIRKVGTTASFNLYEIEVPLEGLPDSLFMGLNLDASSMSSN